MTGNNQPAAAPGDASGDRVACSHCDLPVPRGLVVPDSNEQFCCGGCRVAYQLIHQFGLSAFYSMADKQDSGLAGVLGNGDSGADTFSEFDQDAFFEKFGKSIAGGDREITLLLDGIHCAACIWLIEKLPQVVPGVVDVKLNWARQTARIQWQPDRVTLSKIAQTLCRFGYPPHPYRVNESQTLRKKENRRQVIRMGVAAAAAGNNMLIATALYLGMFSYMSPGMAQLLRVASCLIGLASLLGPGRVFLKGALQAIRTRTPHMDLPIALGLTVGSVAGTINTFRGEGEIYFDSLSVLIFLLLVGRWIQFRQQNKAADSVEMLYRMTPKKTWKVVDGVAVETFVDLVQTGDPLEIRPGELIPVDAVIREGESEVDESILSGESNPVTKRVGDVVLAGTQNRNSVLRVEATATGRETRLGKIVELVEQAALNKPAIVQWANRVGGYFVISVIGLAIMTFVSWCWIDASVAVDRSVALLIVACPCALALATPLAISVAIGRAAKRKIMIKGGDVLQRLDQPGMIWLDKTGTLTEASLDVVEWIGDVGCLASVAALESKSTHPVAKAIVSYAIMTLDRSEGELAVEGVATDVIEAGGGGISGHVGDHEVVIGNESFLSQHGVDWEGHWRPLANQALNRNLSPCWVAVDGAVVAVVALGNHIRTDTKDALEQLKKKGWQVGILSGDHEAIVQQVAGRLGIAEQWAKGGLTPEDKVEYVSRSFKTHGTVAMVGDGVNDSAALAAASVGIAVRNSAEASLAAAPVYLSEEGLQPILTLLKVSQSAGRTIRSNLVVSIGYNGVGATLAAIGWINPLAAAILMPISSLTVVAVSMAAGKTKKGD